MVTQTFNIHLVPDEIRPKVYLSQYDKYLTQLAFNLVNQNDYYQIPSGTYVSLVGKKPDGTAFSYACAWSGHTVTIDVTDQITAVAGKVDAELRFTNGSGTQILSSVKIEMVIERSPLDGTVCSRNDFVDVDATLLGARSDAVAAANYRDQAQAAAADAKNIKNTAVSQIQSAQGTALDAISTARSSAVSAVSTQQTVSVNAVNNAGTSVVDTINSTKNSAVSTVNATGTSAVASVNAAKNTALSEVQASTNNLDSIASAAEARVTSTANTAVANVNEKYASVMSELDSVETSAAHDYNTVLQEMQTYAKDPSAVIYQHIDQSDSLRITAMAAIIDPQEPNSVVYTYDDTTNSLTMASS